MLFADFHLAIMKQDFFFHDLEPKHILIRTKAGSLLSLNPIGRHSGVADGYAASQRHRDLEI